MAAAPDGVHDGGSAAPMPDPRWLPLSAALPAPSSSLAPPCTVDAAMNEVWSWREYAADMAGTTPPSTVAGRSGAAPATCGG